MAAAKAALLEEARGSEMANAGKDDFFGAPDDGGIVGQLRVGAQSTQGLHHRGEIPSFVIDDGRSQESLGAGQHCLELLIARTREAQSTGEGFEERFDFVVTRSTVHRLHVDVGAAAAGEAFKEILDQF